MKKDEGAHVAIVICKKKQHIYRGRTWSCNTTDASIKCKYTVQTNEVKSKYNCKYNFFFFKLFVVQKRADLLFGQDIWLH